MTAKELADPSERAMGCSGLRKTLASERSGRCTALRLMGAPRAMSPTDCVRNCPFQCEGWDLGRSIESDRFVRTLRAIVLDIQLSRTFALTRPGHKRFVHLAENRCHAYGDKGCSRGAATTRRKESSVLSGVTANLSHSHSHTHSVLIQHSRGHEDFYSGPEGSMRIRHRAQDNFQIYPITVFLSRERPIDVALSRKCLRLLPLYVRWWQTFGAPSTCHCAWSILPCYMLLGVTVPHCPSSSGGLEIRHWTRVFRSLCAPSCP